MHAESPASHDGAEPDAGRTNEQLLARLDASALDGSVGILVLAAALGERELDDALGGEAPTRLPLDTLESVEPAHLYLADVTVEGFRGVGPSTTLGLVPGCGLTLVVGRNGSGKSSFAEAAELVLTGNNQRWDEKSAVWKDGWGNLHHEGDRRIAVHLQADGERGRTRVTTRWAAGDTLEARITRAQRPGGPETSLQSLGLGPALETWRPFLSYDDLGSLLHDRPSDIHDRLSKLLGLEDWAMVEMLLKDRGKHLTALIKTADAGAKALRTRLVLLDDDRAVRALDALPAKSAWDLDTLEALATGTADPDPELGRLRALTYLTSPDPSVVLGSAEGIRTAAACVAGFAGTDAHQARHLADLLEQAVGYQEQHSENDHTCPVCRTADVLTDAWRRDASEKLRQLRVISVEISAAESALHALVAEGRALIEPVPAAVTDPPSGVDTSDLLDAWNAWTDLTAILGATAGAEADAVADHLEARAWAVTERAPAVVVAAIAELERRQDLWRPVAESISEWLDGARQAQDGRATVDRLKKAAAWVAAESDRVRAERFAPIAQQVKDIWQQLRHDSNVSIDDLALDGTATRRRLNLSVSVDDTEASGMSVLSQGELHALSLALFLPRATQAASPFRFVLIDDPVQALDAARVDGLARVLATVAVSRQVVVFTHDERLPDACRRLDIAARILEVSRGERSALTIRAIDGPAERYLDDARAIINTEAYPESARRRVVPGLCRQAVEATCVDLARRRLLAGGAAFADVEQQIADGHKCLQHVALAVIGDGTKTGDVYGRLNAWDRTGRSVDLLKQLNTGSHEAIDTDPDLVVRDTTNLVALLRERAG